MTAPPRRDWMDHALAEALLRFNFLPSTWLHPSRAAQWQGPLADHLDEAAAQVVHRHVSAQMLDEWQLGMVDGLGDPVLPLCLLPAEAFERLALRCGLALLGAAIRRVIVRDELLALEAALGADELAFALRRSGAAPGPGWPVPGQVDAARARAIALEWGWSVLERAFASAPAPVARRAMLRLPADFTSPFTPAADGGDTARALSLARDVLQETDPSWHSSFHATP